MILQKWNWDKFLLTHPLRGATKRCKHEIYSKLISTHAPLARCDIYALENVVEMYNFYSRTPCEVRRDKGGFIDIRGLFLLTHPLRGATCAAGRKKTTLAISTHAPLARCDLLRKCHYFSSAGKFLLTHPLRGATTENIKINSRDINFYSRTPCEVRLNIKTTPKEIFDDFYSRTPCEVRLTYR